MGFLRFAFWVFAIPLGLALVAIPTLDWYSEWCSSSAVDWFAISEENGWFASGEPRADNETLVPFTIDNFEATMRRIRERVASVSTVEPPVSPAPLLDYGMPGAIVRELAARWLEYNASNWQRRVNLVAQAQFHTQIEGLRVHFWRARTSSGARASAGVGARPRRHVNLLLLHGWPSSPFEFYKLVELLTSPSEFDDLEFDVVVPSLPGFAWSEANARPDFGLEVIARICLKLMRRLELDRDGYLVYGTDWGAIIAPVIAALDLRHAVRGVHLQMVTPAWHRPLFWLHVALARLFPRLYFDSHEQYDALFPLAQRFGELLRRAGYFAIQATRPDTLGLALLDSPVGTLAWIAEKYIDWSLPPSDTFAGARLGPGAAEVAALARLNISLDEILTQATIFEATRSIGTSVRTYKQAMDYLGQGPLSPAAVMGHLRGLPLAVTIFPNDLGRALAEPFVRLSLGTGNLVQYTQMPHGGHFGALQTPALLAHDIAAFARRISRASDSASPAAASPTRAA